MRGNDITLSVAKEKCTSAVFNSQINANLSSVKNNQLNLSDVAYPWGIYSKFIFSDKFQLMNLTDSSTITIDEEDLKEDSLFKISMHILKFWSSHCLYLNFMSKLYLL